MIYLLAITIILLFLSYIKDKGKTGKALKIALKRLIKILPSFSSMLILVAIILYLVPEEVISHYLGKGNILLSTIMALFLGSLTFLPGFIVFPLCGILSTKGVPFMVLSAFTTTLMMVGIVTFPLEKEYLGVKTTIIRNVIGLIIAVIVAIITGFFFGDIGV